MAGAGWRWDGRGGAGASSRAAHSPQRMAAPRAAGGTSRSQVCHIGIDNTDVASTVHTGTSVKSRHTGIDTSQRTAHARHASPAAAGAASAILFFAVYYHLSSASFATRPGATARRRAADPIAAGGARRRAAAGPWPLLGAPGVSRGRGRTAELSCREGHVTVPLTNPPSHPSSSPHTSCFALAAPTSKPYPRHVQAMCHRHSESALTAKVQRPQGHPTHTCYKPLLGPPSATTNKRSHEDYNGHIGAIVHHQVGGSATS